MGFYYVTDKGWLPWVPEDNHTAAIKRGDLTLYLVSSSVQRLVLAKNPAEAGNAFEKIHYDDAVKHQIESVLMVEAPSDVEGFDPKSIVPVVDSRYSEPTVTEAINIIFPETKKTRLREEAKELHLKAVTELENKIKELNKKLSETLESINKQ